MVVTRKKPVYDPTQGGTKTPALGQGSSGRPADKFKFKTTGQPVYTIGGQTFSPDEYQQKKKEAEIETLTDSKFAGYDPTKDVTKVQPPTPEEIKQQSFIPPQELEEDIKPSGLDALDAAKVVSATAGGALGGAAIGTKLGALAAPLTGGASIPIGAGAGALIGGVTAALTTLFYSSAAERKQQTKVSYQKFQDATSQMDNIIKDVNAQNYSNSQARANWDNEYLRVLQSERELKSQQETLFGEKLSRSMDELGKVEAWKRRYQQYNLEFELSLAAPDPTKIRASIASPVDTTEQNI